MTEENEFLQHNPSLYGDAVSATPPPTEGLVSPAEVAFHDAKAIVENKEEIVDMTWPDKEGATTVAPQWSEPQSKLVEGDPNAPVASDDLVGGSGMIGKDFSGEVASPDLIGDAQSAADTIKPAEEEPDTTVPYHSMDVASDANFNTEVPPVMPEKKDLPKAEDIWSGKAGDDSGEIAA